MAIEGDYINKWLYFNTMKCYLAIKRNKLLLNPTTSQNSYAE